MERSSYDWNCPGLSIVLDSEREREREGERVGEDDRERRNCCRQPQQASLQAVANEDAAWVEAAC